MTPAMSNGDDLLSHLLILSLDLSDVQLLRVMIDVAAARLALFLRWRLADVEKHTLQVLLLHRQFVSLALLAFAFLVVRSMSVFAPCHRRHALSVRRLLRVLIAYDDLIFAIVRLGCVRVNVLVILCLVRRDAVAQAIVASGGLLITQLSRSMWLLVVS